MRQSNLRNDQRYQANYDTKCTICTDAYFGSHVECQPHHHRPEDDVHGVQNCICFETSESFELVHFLGDVFVSKEGVRFEALRSPSVLIEICRLENQYDNPPL